jgi:hypothetical protein
VFRTEPGGLSAGELGHALAFAEVAVTMLLDGRTTPCGAGGGPAKRSSTAPSCFQAQGMVMVQLGVSLAEALTRIRAFAFADNRSLHDVPWTSSSAVCASTGTNVTARQTHRFRSEGSHDHRFL